MIFWVKAVYGRFTHYIFFTPYNRKIRLMQIAFSYKDLDPLAYELKDRLEWKTEKEEVTRSIFE